MSEPKRYSVIVNADSVEQVESDKGGFVLYDDYAILKADLEKSDRVVYILAVENERLKADVLSEHSTKYHQALSANRKLLAENASLKTEVVRLKQVRDYEHYLSVQIGAMTQENARLNAELDKYRKDVTNSVDDLLDERKSLKAEVERLTKAGDAMCKWIKGFNQPHISAFEWNAAKEGKSHP